MNEEAERYIESHIAPEPQQLNDIYRRTHLRHVYPRMCSGHLQGRILSMISHMVKPYRVLELGAFTGYSTLCLAEGLAPGGLLYTIELDDELEDELLEEFNKSPFGGSIKLIIGDALELVGSIDEMWDLVFIDANKRNYVEYFELIVDKVRKGGYILADNTLWGGKMYDPEAKKDTQYFGIEKFNELVARDPRVETVILPLRDGLTLMRRL